MRLYKNFTTEELTVSIPIEDKQGTMFPIVTAGYTKIFEKILDHCGIRNRFTRRPELDAGGYIAWSLTEDPDMILALHLEECTIHLRIVGMDILVL